MQVYSLLRTIWHGSCLFCFVGLIPRQDKRVNTGFLPLGSEVYRTVIPVQIAAMIRTGNVKGTARTDFSRRKPPHFVRVPQSSCPPRFQRDSGTAVTVSWDAVHQSNPAAMCRHNPKGHASPGTHNRTSDMPLYGRYPPFQPTRQTRNLSSWRSSTANTAETLFRASNL